MRSVPVAATPVRVFGGYLFFTHFIFSVGEHDDAARALNAKLRRANTVISAWRRCNRCSDLSDSEDVIILRKRAWILASYVRCVLQPSARFRIDDSQLLLCS